MNIYRGLGLIEAYWNVNEIYKDWNEALVAGLIEAYWNVNMNREVLQMKTNYGLIVSIH